MLKQLDCFEILIQPTPELLLQLPLHEQCNSHNECINNFLKIPSFVRCMFGDLETLLPGRGNVLVKPISIQKSTLSFGLVWSHEGSTFEREKVTRPAEIDPYALILTLLRVGCLCDIF